MTGESCVEAEGGRKRARGRDGDGDKQRRNICEKCPHVRLHQGLSGLNLNDLQNPMARHGRVKIIIIVEGGDNQDIPNGLKNTFCPFIFMKLNALHLM